MEQANKFIANKPPFYAGNFKKANKHIFYGRAQRLAPTFLLVDFSKVANLIFSRFFVRQSCRAEAV